MLRQMRIHSRGPHPSEQPIIDARPEYDSAIAMCLEAWHDLGSCRPLGFSGAGFIPFTAVLAWAEFNRLDHELTTMLLAVIQRLDRDRAEREASAHALRGGR